MQEFYVQFRSLRDVLDFVTLASKQKHRLIVGNDHFQVNANSFMGIFTLNFRKPQRVTAECTEEEFRQILADFDRFLVT